MKKTLRILLILLITGLTGVLPIQATTGFDVFRGFTTHISEQIGKDKQEFFVAQSCTTWFYKNLKPPFAPKIEKIVFQRDDQSFNEKNCASHYPNGLDGAREDFSRTQVSLSLSLTFFQFALVVDRDDDRQYSAGELQDLMDSFGMEYESQHPSGWYVMTLNREFDTIRGQVEFQKLMDSMDSLYKKGYRFTPTDQATLDQELG